MNYIVFSTFKSFKNFKRIRKQIEKQKPLPIVWYIYNDSGKRIEIEKGKFPIKIINGKKNDFWYYKRLAGNLNYLFKKIKKKHWNKINCLMKIDDDTIIPDKYIELLMPFIENSNFGCVSGKIYSKSKKRYVYEKRINHYAIGTGMLIRKEIFDYLKEYPLIAGSDTVINLASCYLGYQNQQLNHIELKQLRLTGQECGMSRSLATAIKQYYLRYPKIIILLNLRRNNKAKFWENYKAYKLRVKKVSETERLNNTELINFNKKRIFLVILRDLIRRL